MKQMAILLLLAGAVLPVLAQSQFTCVSESELNSSQGASCSADDVQVHLLRKCVDAKGRASFQNAACATGSHEVSAQAYVPEIERPKPVQRSPPPRTRHELSTRGRYRNTSPTSRISSESKRCDAAKANREAVLKRVGLRRTYDLLSRLDEKVREACKLEW